MVSFLTQPLTLITKGKKMTDKKQNLVEERLAEIEQVIWPDGKDQGHVADAITGIIAIIQHLINVYGDYIMETQIKRDQLAESLSYVYQSIGGEVIPEDEPSSDKPNLHVVKEKE